MSMGSCILTFTVEEDNPARRSWKNDALVANYLFSYSQTTAPVGGGGISKMKVSLKQCILTFTD